MLGLAIEHFTLEDLIEIKYRMIGTGYIGGKAAKSGTRFSHAGAIVEGKMGTAKEKLEMLADADDTERQVLAAFPYQRNDAVLHTDVSILPRRRRAWASWNYHLSPEPHSPATVTYDLSRLQRVNSPEPILLTLNDEGRIDPAKVIRRILYHHPAYGPDSIAAQKRHAEINGRRRTWFCGAYWGYGFHEDGVRSGLAVARCFGKDLETCTAASTKGESGTADTSR